VVESRHRKRLAGCPSLIAGAYSRGGGQVGVGGCEMPLADVLEARDPLGLGELRELSLRPVGRALEQLLVDVLLARFA
jgi:hypothetical protein